jgi:hypothetical protein
VLMMMSILKWINTMNYVIIYIIIWSILYTKLKEKINYILHMMIGSHCTYCVPIMHYIIWIIHEDIYIATKHGFRILKKLDMQW